jgi:hypothetical protein
MKRMKEECEERITAKDVETMILEDVKKENDTKRNHDCGNCKEKCIRCNQSTYCKYN